ncbi:hypothetical protein TYRP_021604, partial [Tyrophagus putrescentiae]
LVQKNTVKFISQFLVWVRLQNVDQRQFFSYKGLLENASNSVKRRAILMMTAADRYITAMLVTIVLTDGLFIIAFRKLIFGGFPWYCRLWIIADTAIALYTAFRLFQVGFYLIGCNILTAIVIAGRMLTAVLLTNLPLNALVQSRLVLSRSSAHVERLLNALILAIHLAGFYQCLLPLLVTTKKLHAPQKTVATVQYHLAGRRWTLLKLKLDDLRGRLGCGPKMAFTIAPGKQVTDEVIVEVVQIIVNAFVFTNTFFTCHCS